MEEKHSKYKIAMEEIESIVAKLEDNQLEIDELSANVKRVSELIAFCKSMLQETEQEVENILKSMDDK